MKKKAAKIRPKGAGVLEHRNGHWWVRVSLPDGSRPRYRLCGVTCDCHAMSEARRLDRAEAISERERERVRKEMAEREKLAVSKRLTVQQLGEAWTSGKLHDEHGEANKLREKRSAPEDKYRLAWACKVKMPTGRTFGDTLVLEVTEADAQRVMVQAQKLAEAERGIKWRPATKLQLYSVLHRLFELAVIPCRLRQRGSNPFTPELRPRMPQGDLLFQWLYPDELLALLRCKDVPVIRRVLYTVATYTGQRKESLRALRWADADFDHGVLTSPHQKNGVPLTFDMPEDLSGLLWAWYLSSGSPAGEKLIFNKLGCRWQNLADQLRADLLAAGVTRASLQGEAEHEEPLRFHDLRATLVVWGLKDPTKGYGWVTDRTGHLTPRMLQRYDRAARNWKEAKLVPFPALAWELEEPSSGQGCAVPELSRKLAIKHLRVVG